MRRLSILAVVGLFALTGSFAVAQSTSRVTGPALASDDRSSQAAALYQPQPEFQFVPITPCRAFDTREDAKISAGQTRGFKVAGTNGFVGQGGQAGGCGVPLGAGAVALNLTATDGTKTSAVTAFAAGAARPDIFSLRAGKNTSATAGSIVALGASGGVKIYVTNPVNVIGDVTGYFVKPLAVMVSESGGLYSGSSRAISSSKTATGTYEVQFDRNIRYCTATVTVYYTAYHASTTTWFDSEKPDTVRVVIWNSAGSLADAYFYLTVNC